MDESHLDPDIHLWASHSKYTEILCEQYSDEWWQARKGLLTASRADKLITPAGRASTQWKAEIAKILAEQLGLQEPAEIPTTYWMERGTQLEGEAARWLEVAEDIETDQCGIFVSDCFGASPDRVIREEQCNIPVEIKCPMPSTQISYLLDGGLPKAYLAQVHFQIALLDAPYGLFMSYHPELDPLIVKVERDKVTELMVDQMDIYQVAFYEALKKMELSEPLCWALSSRLT